MLFFGKKGYNSLLQEFSDREVRYMSSGIEALNGRFLRITSLESVNTYP